jgi:hypothetical protein
MHVYCGPCNVNKCSGHKLCDTWISIPDLPLHGRKGVIGGIHCFPQVDQPNDREGTRGDLESERERGLCFPRGRHLQRMDKNDG